MPDDNREDNKMPTLFDVAKYAGVAPITVSRVVNNSGYISNATREKVNNAIRVLGYVPNTLARSLRLRQTQILALVITDITNPFFTTVVRGVEDAASDAGFNLILCNTDESEEEEDKYLRVLVQKHVDGIILVPARSSLEPIRYVQKQRVPLVVVDRRLPGVSADSVYCDSVEGAFALVRLLISKGHQRIVVLGGPLGVSTAEDRLEGYRRALREAAIPCEERFVLIGKFTVESGYQMMQQALSQTPRPTAVFACNNFIAIGALKAIWAAGLHVPDDIAVVSFDDLPDSMMVNPFLTAAAQPAYQMGYKATEMLIARISGSAPEKYLNVILPTEIIIRNSSG